MELSSRLDTLLDNIFAGRIDLVSLFRQISAELPSSPPLALKKKLRRLLTTVDQIRADSALLVAGVLRLTGFPSPRILHFLSLYVPGTITVSQFEFASQALYPRGLPMTQGMLYDLTQYTYLEKRLLMRKSMEVTAALRDSLSPDLLLFLFLLSLRNDLSNENAQLIALILKGLFPAFEQRTRLGSEILEEYGEIAEAWRKAGLHSLLLEAGRGDTARAERPFDRQSASYFLDKYFSDAALADQQGEAAVEPSQASPPPAPPRRTAKLRTVDKPRQTAQPKKADRPGQAVRHKQKARPQQAVKPVEASIPSPIAQIPSPLPAKSIHLKTPPSKVLTAGQTSPRRTAAEWRIPAPIIPFYAGAAIVLALTILAVSLIPLPGGGAQRLSVPAAATAAKAAPAASDAETSTAAGQARQTEPERTYVIQEGDSLWRIYQSLNPDAPGRWEEFLSRIRADNGLVDPDRIWPGRTLKIKPLGD